MKRKSSKAARPEVNLAGDRSGRSEHREASSAERPRCTQPFSGLVKPFRTVFVTAVLCNAPVLHAQQEIEIDEPNTQQDGGIPTTETIRAIPGIDWAPPTLSNGVRIYSRFGSFGARFGNSLGKEFSKQEGGKEDDSDKDAGTDCNQTESNIKGNPINIATGNKLEPELDFAAQGEMALFLQRTYNRNWYGVGLFGWHWLSNFDYRLSFFSSYPSGEGVCYARPSIAECTNTGSAIEVWAHRPDGRKVKYIKAGDGVYYEDKASPVSRIVRQANGTWVLYGEENQSETYSVGGYPLSVINEAGIGWTFTYGGLQSTQLQRVTHTSGRFVDLVWVDDELREVRDPAGRAYRYSYQGQKIEVGLHVLQTTTRPGTPSTVITYHYEPEFGFNSLTGKSYNGVRYSTFKYDASYRAISSEHAGGVEKYSFIYTNKPDGTMTVAETNPLGKQATYVFKDGKVQSVTGLPSNSCAGAYKESQYDANGYEDLVADFNGNIVNYDYNAKGQLIKRVEGFGTPAARTTIYDWDSAVNRISSVTIQDLSQTDYTYTAGNRVASVAVSNLSSRGVQGQVLTTRYAYTTHPNGLLATAAVDGPLPNDTTTYTYSAAGDLTQVKNGLGHAITYSNYNALGQAGRVTYPNGDIVDFEYDDRNRLKTIKRIVNGVAQTTSYTYTPEGTIASVGTPDGRTRHYIYDAALRVIEEYEREPEGTYARKLTDYNAASLPTRVEVHRSTYPRDTRVIGHIDGVDSSYHVVGWACSTGQNAPIDVHFYAGAGWPSGTYVGAFQANRSSEAGVAAACAAEGAAYRFQIALTESVRDLHGGKGIYIHGISPAGKDNSLIDLSGTWSIPRLVPNTAPAGLTAPTEVTAGSYTVSWSALSRATSYRLEESFNNGAWSVAHSAGTTSKAFSGKGTGTYRYRVTGCNESGCGPMSGEISVREIDPPTAAPTLSAPSVNTSGSYTVGWTGVAEAAFYKLEESANGGAWTLVHDGAGANKAFAGKSVTIPYSYRMRACNAAGCGPYSATSIVQQVIYGAEYVWQSVPTLMVGGGTYSVTVQMRNTGNSAWSEAEAFRLGSQNPGDNTRWGTSRVSVPGSVAPGATATFTFNVVAPSAAGGYSFQWRMVRDGYAWFGAITPNVGVVVATGAISATPNPCGLYIGETICTSQLNWSSSRSDAEVWVTNMDNSGAQLFARAQNGSQYANWIPTVGKRFHLKSGSVTLASVDVYATQTNQYPPPPPEPEPKPCATQYCQEP